MKEALSQFKTLIPRGGSLEVPFSISWLVLLQVLPILSSSRSAWTPYSVLVLSGLFFCNQIACCCTFCYIHNFYIPVPSDPEHINITVINIDALTWKTVTMPAEIRPNQCGSLRYKVDTEASGNVMSLHVFAKLFPRCITTDGKQTGLCPCDTRLTAYNKSNIPQFGALDTATEWTPKGHQHSGYLQTRWYVAEPAILGLPSSSKLGIVQLNCTVKLTSRCDPPSPPKKATTEHGKVRHNLTSPFNSSKDLIKAYPDQFEGIGWFSGTYHITLWDDAKPVVHAPRKCLIAMWPLMHEKLDEFIDQGIIVPVEEPTDWVSLLAY